jgi:hypothetical protein
MPLLLLLLLDAELALPLDDDGVSAIADPDAARANATHNETKNATRFITLTSRTST